MQVTARSHTYIKQSFLNLEGITPINCMKKKKCWAQPLLFEAAFKSDGKFVTRHFRNECRVRFESRLHTEVIQRNETAKDRCSNAAFERHSQRKGKEKEQKEKSGVTHHYNTKTNKIL